MDIKLIMMLMAFTVMVSRAQSQTIFPYIRYKGVILPNNSYIDLSQLGDGDRIECVTDLENCCMGPLSNTSPFRAWYFPNGTKLFEAGTQVIRAFEVIEGAQQFDLRLSDPTVTSDLSLSGVYHCLIDTSIAQDARIYVGLYYSRGNGGMSTHKCDCVCVYLIRMTAVDLYLTPVICIYVLLHIFPMFHILLLTAIKLAT